jgi:hypothetical protein
LMGEAAALAPAAGKRDFTEAGMWSPFLYFMVCLLARRAAGLPPGRKCAWNG